MLSPRILTFILIFYIFLSAKHALLSEIAAYLFIWKGKCVTFWRYMAAMTFTCCHFTLLPASSAFWTHQSPWNMSRNDSTYSRCLATELMKSVYRLSFTTPSSHLPLCHSVKRVERVTRERKCIPCVKRGSPVSSVCCSDLIILPVDEQVAQLWLVMSWLVRNLLPMQKACVMDKSLPFHYQIGIDE